MFIITDVPVRPTPHGAVVVARLQVTAMINSRIQRVLYLNNTKRKDITESLLKLVWALLYKKTKNINLFLMKILTISNFKAFLSKTIFFFWCAAEDRLIDLKLGFNLH